MIKQIILVCWIVIGVLNLYDVELIEDVVLVYEDGIILDVGLVEKIEVVYIDVQVFWYLYYLLMLGFVNSYYYIGLIFF